MRLVRDAARTVDRFLFEPIDARVYAAVRIVYAVICLATVVELWPVRHLLFNRAGTIVRVGALPWYVPLRWIDSKAGVTAFMIATGVCCVSAGIGLLTRASTVAMYLWAFSYSAVAYPAETGYDGLVRVGGFVLAISPTARRWAVDGVLFGRGPAELPRYGLRLMQWQLGIVYFVTVWLKLPDPYWRSGELISYFMMSIFSRVATPSWAQWGRVSALLTWGTLLLESAIPVLLFSRRGRRLGFACGIALHGGIALASTIGMFSLCMAPFYAAFLKAEDFDALGARARMRFRARGSA